MVIGSSAHTTMVTDLGFADYGGERSGREPGDDAGENPADEQAPHDGAAAAQWHGKASRWRPSCSSVGGKRSGSEHVSGAVPCQRLRR
jgi:hypothetical protein